MVSVSLGSILRFLSLLGAALVAFQLYRHGLHRRYPIFFTFLLFRVPEGFWAMSLDTRTNAYMYTWGVTQPVFWIFHVLLVVELSQLVLASYRGLYSIFRTAMIASTVVSLAISALSFLPQIKPTAPQRSKILLLFLAADRGVEFSLAIFILLILLVMSRYPLCLSRNVRAHAMIYSVYFLSNTMGLLLRSMLGLHLGNEINILFAVAELGAVIGWLVVLRPEGEKIPQLAIRLNGEQERRLLTQLDALNTTLLKVSRPKY
jgi:hypothetical protein